MDASATQPVASSNGEVVVQTLRWAGESAGLAYNVATGSTHLLAVEALALLQAGNARDWQQHWRTALDAIGVDATDDELSQWRDQLAAAGLLAS